MGKQTNLIRLGALPRVKTKFSERVGFLSRKELKQDKVFKLQRNIAYFFLLYFLVLLILTT